MTISSQLFILFFVVVSYCFGQTKTPPVGKYIIGDTLIEVKEWKELNSIFEFKEIRGTNITFFKDLYMDTKLIRREGVFKEGECTGIWKFYNKSGQLEKEIDYDSNIKILYGKPSDVYDELFNQIQKKAELLLKEKYGNEFVSNHIIQNTNHSYYYGFGKSGSWFEVPNYVPTEFLMRYDIKIFGNKRIPFLEFTLVDSGELKDKGSIKIFLNLKNQNLITQDIVDSLALKKGLTKEAEPFSYSLHFLPDVIQKDAGELELHVIGKPYNMKTVGNEITELFVYIVFDPWTGQYLRKNIGERITIVD